MEYGLWRPGSAGFSRDARQVLLAGFGLRPGERFTYEYDLACDEDWCGILSVMAHGDLMLAAISGRRDAHGGSSVRQWRRGRHAARK